MTSDHIRIFQDDCPAVLTSCIDTGMEPWSCAQNADKVTSGSSHPLQLMLASFTGFVTVQDSSI